jgi:hypothetical protein
MDWFGVALCPPQTSPGQLHPDQSMGRAGRRRHPNVNSGGAARVSERSDKQQPIDKQACEGTRAANPLTRNWQMLAQESAATTSIL